MDPFLARTMVENLSKGIDPLSGRALPYSDSCSNEEIQDALLEVLAHCTIESNEMYLLRLRKEKEEENKRRREENRRAEQEEQRRRKQQLFKQFPRETEKWTAEDEENLLYLHREGYSFYLISNVLNRSPDSIAKHLKKLQNKPVLRQSEDGFLIDTEWKPRNAGLPWTIEEDRVLCRMFDEGYAVIKMCEKLQRSKEALAARLVRLGKIRSRREFRGK